jgi:cellulose synthase/poly-beta-1,6-N-acetylglucosamine synthase-like glycosyltransferase
MLLFLCLITLLATVAQAISFQRLFNYVQAELKHNPVSAYSPKVSVILPCKGLDPGFAENIQKLLKQRYFANRSDGDGQVNAQPDQPNFEVIFAVAERSDPAYSVLKEICEEGGSVRTRLVVAGLDARRGQKINNQLAALREVSDQSEVFVFVDSDVIARDDFLGFLVAHLRDASVGATTGYRFYIPFGHGWASLIRALWNRMSAWEMANPSYSFAWGGAMAITRSNFVRAKVLESWDRSCDDDLALTTAVKNLGLAVRFVPQCLVFSQGDGSASEIIEWTNRQLILTKVYYPKLWRKAIYRAVILTAWLIAVLACLFMIVASGGSAYVRELCAGLMLIPIEFLFLLKAQNLWRRVLLTEADHRSSRKSASSLKDKRKMEVELASLEKAYDDSFWKFTLALPLAHLILPWMTLYSVITNRIRWRGVNYELRSPTETVTI